MEVVAAVVLGCIKFRKVLTYARTVIFPFFGNFDFVEMVTLHISFLEIGVGVVYLALCISKHKILHFGINLAAILFSYKYFC